MFAAHAAAQHNWCEVTVLSDAPAPTVQRGAQYLHKPIPNLSNLQPDGWVTYIKLGAQEGYAERVYGKRDAPVSWSHYENGQHRTWNLRRTYKRAWDRYKHLIRVVAPLDHKDIEFIDMNADLVINTIPLTKFMDPSDSPAQYGAVSQPVWIRSWSEHYPHSGDVIVYNGKSLDRPASPWYRFSRLYGWCAYEYSTPPDAALQAVRVEKPLTIESKPVPSHWLCLGRYGAWDKAQLTHDAYYRTAQYLDDVRLMG
jgi:hypothetical protein